MQTNRNYRWDWPISLVADSLPEDVWRQRQRCILLAIMKNEAPYIVEWATYHYALGFREIIVFSNFSDDYTDEILDRLDDLGIVRHRPHPINAFSSVGQFNIAALRFAKHFANYQASDFMMMIDADEFLEVGAGQYDLNAFFDLNGEFEVASFLMRGMRGKDERLIKDGQLLDRFRQATWRRGPVEGERTIVGGSVKSLARTKFKNGFHRNHRPMNRRFSKMGLRWIDGGGAAFGPEFTDRRVSSVKRDRASQVGVVNHYALRSLEGFMVKIGRGAAAAADRKTMNETAQRKWCAYWNNRNKSPTTDEPQQFLPPLFNDIFNLISSDPIISELQQAALASHRKRAKEMAETAFGQSILEGIGMSGEALEDRRTQLSSE
ncbi:glycosyltransferase family 2 protein [Yoonia sp.]|uniref:glycosyltransferase family 2 protein n=1 Tax=Yoonia sp. TaxID=2212373 RepID=UPI002FDB6D2E